MRRSACLPRTAARPVDRRAKIKSERANVIAAPVRSGPHTLPLCTGETGGISRSPRHFRFWPIATIRGNAALRSLLGAERTLTAPRSQHRIYGRTRWQTCAVHSKHRPRARQVSSDPLLLCSRQPLPFFLLALAQPDAWSAAVLVDELDAGNLNRRLDLHCRAKNRIS
jgi:hypothetical protein